MSLLEFESELRFFSYEIVVQGEQENIDGIYERFLRSEFDLNHNGDEFLELTQSVNVFPIRPVEKERSVTKIDFPTVEANSMFYSLLASHAIEDPNIIVEKLKIGRYERYYIMRAAALVDFCREKNIGDIQFREADGFIGHEDSWLPQSEFQNRFESHLKAFHFGLPAKEGIETCYRNTFFHKGQFEFNWGQENPTAARELFARDLYRSQSIYGCLRTKIELCQKLRKFNKYFIICEKTFCIMMNIIDIELRDDGLKPMSTNAKDLVSYLGTVRPESDSVGTVSSVLHQLHHCHLQHFADGLMQDEKIAYTVIGNQSNSKQPHFITAMAAVLHFRKHGPEFGFKGNRKTMFHEYLVTCPMRIQKGDDVEKEEKGDDAEKKPLFKYFRLENTEISRYDYMIMKRNDAFVDDTNRKYRRHDSYYDIFTIYRSTEKYTLEQLKEHAHDLVNDFQCN